MQYSNHLQKPHSGLFWHTSPTVTQTLSGYSTEVIRYLNLSVQAARVNSIFQHSSGSLYAGHNIPRLGCQLCCDSRKGIFGQHAILNISCDRAACNCFCKHKKSPWNGKESARRADSFPCRRWVCLFGYKYSKQSFHIFPLAEHILLFFTNISYNSIRHFGIVIHLKSFLSFHISLTYGCIGTYSDSSSQPQVNVIESSDLNSVIFIWNLLSINICTHVYTLIELYYIVFRLSLTIMVKNLRLHQSEKQTFVSIYDVVFT